jgi:hypothetical protein
VIRARRDIRWWKSRHQVRDPHWLPGLEAAIRRYTDENRVRAAAFVRSSFVLVRRSGSEHFLDREPPVVGSAQVRANTLPATYDYNGTEYLLGVTLRAF